MSVFKDEVTGKLLYWARLRGRGGGVVMLAVGEVEERRKLLRWH